MSMACGNGRETLLVGFKAVGVFDTTDVSHRFSLWTRDSDQLQSPYRREFPQDHNTENNRSKARTPINRTSKSL
jgi:hypothetical protein